MQKWMYASMQIYSMQACMFMKVYERMPEWKYESTQVRKYASIQICKYIQVYASIFKYIQAYSSLLKYPCMQLCRFMHVWHYWNIEVCKYMVLKYANKQVSILLCKCRIIFSMLNMVFC